MKPIPALIVAAGLALAAVLGAHAQAQESIWLAAQATTYQAGDTVVATVNAQSATQIQGFTFQIRYDAACLKPINAASPIAGMNGLLLPQKAGLVDASFASTVPQTANGILAEVRFLSLAACQTNLTLESAALAIRNKYGYAAPLSGIAIGNRNVALSVGPASGAAKPTQPVLGTPLPLGVERTTTGPSLLLWLAGLVLLMLLVGGALFALLRWTRGGSSST